MVSRLGLRDAALAGDEVEGSNLSLTQGRSVFVVAEEWPAY